MISILSYLVYILSLQIYYVKASSTNIKDNLLEAIHIADVNRVLYLIQEYDNGILSSNSPVIINRLDEEHNRTSLMTCGLDPQKRTKQETDEDCLIIAKLLYKRGVNISHVDKYGWDVISMASVRGFYIFCDYLIRKGAPHDGIDNEGRTAIMKAAAHGHYETFELLYHKGASIERLDNIGMTALHYATIFTINNEKHYKEFIIKIIHLIKKNSNKILDQYIDKDGRTCLMYAVIYNNYNIVEIFLNIGQSNPEIIDNFGKNALEMTSNVMINNLLREYIVTSINNKHKTWIQSNDL